MNWKQLAANYRSNKLLYWMILPVICFVILFSYVPMFGLTMAFQDYSLVKGIFGSKWIGLENFQDFFTSMYFGRTLRNTLVLSFFDLLFSFPAPIILALMLNEVRRLRYKKLIQTISYMPHFISMIVVAGLIMEFTNSSGVIGSIVSAMGGTPKSYISLPQYFRPIFIVSEIWQHVGFNSIIYLAALSGISEDLYEAARIDGAGRFRQMLNVTLPGLTPTIIIMFILRCGAIMNLNFEKVLLLYSPSTYETADIISTYVYRIGIIKQKIGYSTAVGLFNSVVSFALVLTANKISKTYTEVSMF
ncbi:MAG TPA: ABC transporter permease subunit [Candidatus Limiplasma sp.]|nr:ABC transporter permease subunit [Candidatus Limiplasma sp.]